RSMDSGVVVWRGVVRQPEEGALAVGGGAAGSLGERRHGGGQLRAEVVEPVEAGEKAFRVDADDAVGLDGAAALVREVAVDILSLEIVAMEADGQVRIRGGDEAVEERLDPADGYLVQYRGIGEPGDSVKRALGENDSKRGQERDFEWPLALAGQE